MNFTETILEGTIQADDPFWQRMQAIWAIPIGVESRDGGERSLSQVRNDREEWEIHQQAIEQLQEVCRSRRKQAEK